MGTKGMKKKNSNAPNAPLQGGQNCQLDEGAAEAAVREVDNSRWGPSRRLDCGSLLHFGSNTLVRKKEKILMQLLGTEQVSGRVSFPLQAKDVLSVGIQGELFQVETPARQQYSELTF
jgi:hypothetical protein